MKNERYNDLILCVIIITSFRRKKKAAAATATTLGPRNGIPTCRWREKGSLPCLYVGIITIFYFPFNIPLPDNAAAKDIPSVGRAFYDSHGVFRSLYPFQYNDFAYIHNARTTGITPAPTLNPCIMQLACRR